jgi:phospho-N-acetylmuramoyl-pentapeptide-transferase
VTNVLAAGVLAAVISVVVGPWFIAFLRAQRVGQNIRDEGPEGHKTKQGTPTMGGFLIVVATVLPYLAFSDLNTQSLAILRPCSAAPPSGSSTTGGRSSRVARSASAAATSCSASSRSPS